METGNFIIAKDKKSIKTELWWLVHNIILARYKYKGIDGDDFDMENDSIERALMYSGMCAIFKNKAGKIVALPCVVQALNQYGRPAVVTAYKFAFSTPARKQPRLEPMTTNLEVGTDCAVILNNAQRVSSMAMVQPYINRLAKIWKEHGNNLDMSRIFAMIGGNSEVAEELKKQYEYMLESGILAMNVGDVTTFTKTLSKFDMGVEYRQEEYHKDFETTWIRLLTALGINNVGIEKRERLLVDEVGANNEVLVLIRNTTFNYRKWGIEQANKLFGTKIEVISGGIDEYEEKKQTSNGDSKVGGDDNE